VKFTIITSDNNVCINGVWTTFDFSELINSDIHAVQWSGNSGHIEYKDHIKPNQKIEDISNFQPIIDAYYVAKAEQEQAQLDAEAAAEAAKTYKEKRVEEYPSIGDQLEAIWLAMDNPTHPDVQTIKDQIEVIKAKYPKN